MNFDLDFDKLKEELSHLDILNYKNEFKDSFKTTATALWYRYPLNYYIYRVESKLIDFDIQDDTTLNITKLKRSTMGFTSKYSFEKIKYDFSNKTIDYFEELIRQSNTDNFVYEFAKFTESLDRNGNELVEYTKKLLTDDAERLKSVAERGFSFFKSNIEQFRKLDIDYIKMDDILDYF